ncbi:MAG: UDP-N-acetylglucosamine--N-acetylmuramyl-(pentapeptide) pyrophosphoryl-undecaprenol N-acetylglucosamine transferase [Endomicrobium sp.]|jgi:UDP-N-acetylglucosamine--N-acetylmuramyl-(pentapeptide) pyrophosphoryl-undecaprenol N-acetylglucosamine transferase|nr:UDP-N-acetylglucosamine--N-acetylmuramyl-(pentapeptide) pyrophosphoryl-undecaprenol N-acetylglucosamine transferase [Endomicrobium sp.]
MMKNKLIIIASSGSGGHIYPGISLAEEFKNKGYRIIFFISDNTTSIEILKRSGFEYVTFNVLGMPRKITITFIFFLIRIKLAFLKALKQITKLKPLAVIGMGGYLAVPVIFAAKILHKKVFIHEQNTIPGKANLLLNKVTDKTFVSFQSSKIYLKNSFFSGYPIRNDILLPSKKKSLQDFKLLKKTPTVLIFGGSLGATNLNKIVFKTLFELSIKNEFQVLHITGYKNYIEIEKKAKDNSSYRVFKYMHNIGTAYAASDIVICRSGAGTIFELEVLNKHAILVPYPYATDNHQYLNAKEIEKKDVIILLEEKNLTKEKLNKALYILKKNIKNYIVKNVVKSPQELIFEEIMKCLKF